MSCTLTSPHDYMTNVCSNCACAYKRPAQNLKALANIALMGRLELLMMFYLIGSLEFQCIEYQ